jgi:hypothetical protein
MTAFDDSDGETFLDRWDPAHSVTEFSESPTAAKPMVCDLYGRYGAVHYFAWCHSDTCKIHEKPRVIPACFNGDHVHYMIGRFWSGAII